MSERISYLSKKIKRLRVQATNVVVIENQIASAPDSRFLVYAKNPAGFAADILGVNLVPKQVEAASLILKPPYRILIPSGNELGKTLLSACIVLWWFCTRRPAIVITTAPKFDQVKKLLWKEIRRLAKEARKRAGLILPFQPKACHIERAEDDFAIGTTARDSTGFQGHHGPNQLFVFDEATGVDAEFWEATESMFSPPGHAWVCIFNPTDTSSRAYQEYSQAARVASKEMPATWHVVRMSALDHPNLRAELENRPPPVPHAIRLDKFERLLRSWSQLVYEGDANPATDIQWPPTWATEYIARTHQSPRWYRPGPLAEARLLGRYPRAGTYSVWSDGDWLAAIREAVDAGAPLPIPIHAVPELGVDVARFGDDWTAIHVRCDCCSLGHESANGWDTVTTANRVKELCKLWAHWFNSRAHKVSDASRPRSITEFDIPIKIDDDGVGCITGDTMVLTVDHGWIPAANVKEGMRVYSKGTEGNPVSVEFVTENVKREKTRVLSCGSYRFSFSHFLPYKTRKEYKWQMGSWDKILKSSCTWLDTEFNWAGCDSDIDLAEHEIEMPNGGTRVYREAHSIPGDAFAKFLGWFLSEGCFDGRYISIVQKNKSGKALIEGTLNEMGMSYCVKNGSKSSGGGIIFSIGNQQLKRWLAENCYTEGTERGAFRKKIPSWLFEQSSRRISLFLDSYVEGDGFFRKDGMREISCSNKRLTDDLQTALMLAGSYGSIRVHGKKGSIGRISGREFKRTADNYRLAEWRGNGITVQPPFNEMGESLEHVYEIKITGPTRLYMVKFSNERPFWVHNGGVTDILRDAGYQVMPISAASTSLASADYPNRRSELWFVVAERARSNELDLSRLDEDTLDELHRQALAPQWSMDARARRVVETKDEMKQRLGRSPDDMDAVNLAYAEYYAVTGEPIVISRRAPMNSISDELERIRRRQEESMRGGRAPTSSRMPRY